jgi:hypothetical protein
MRMRNALRIGASFAAVAVAWALVVMIFCLG